MTRFSIIIAVYNISEYIKSCVDSLIFADTWDTEILLIDDGSNDSSGKICDELASENENVKVYHKPNGGLSDARNYGLEQACGEWIIFIDGDDSVISKKFKEFIEKLCHIESDVVFNDYVLNNLYNNRVSVTHQAEWGATLEEVLKKPGAVWNVWRFAYKRKFLVHNELKFKVGYLAEDMEFTTRILSMSNLSFECVSLPYYIYSYHRNGSIMENSSLRFIDCMTEIVQTEYSRLLNRKDNIAKLLRRKLMRDYVYHSEKIYKFNGKHRKEFVMYYHKASTPFNPLVLAPLLHIMRKAYHLER